MYTNGCKIAVVKYKADLCNVKLY